MALKTKCNQCKREAKSTDGWWEVIELQRHYYLCPSCYRNVSLNAYRETLLERIKDIQVSHSEPDIKMGMEIMRNRCEAIVRDTVFNV
jgi:hypothetical protein